MQNLTHELNGILSEELGLYVGLLEYGKRKKAALIGNDVDEIGRLTRLESESLDRLKCAVVHREALFTALANEDGYRGKVDIDYLAKKLPENDRGALEALRDKYKEVVRELSALNKLNQNLLRTQLQYTSFCIDAIMQQSEPVTGTYASSGQISTGGGTPRRLIEREA